jgi:hypothetical protein
MAALRRHGRKDDVPQIRPRRAQACRVQGSQDPVSVSLLEVGIDQGASGALFDSGGSSNKKSRPKRTAFLNTLRSHRLVIVIVKPAALRQSPSPIPKQSGYSLVLGD